MKCTENWLKEYVAVEFGPDEIAARLTMLGLEVDAVEPLYPGLDGVCVGRVLSVTRHPNADRLSLCEVDDGGERPRRVVCGAPNVRPGMFTPLALPGAVLPGNFKIKASKIRGESSEGMLCADRELGLAEGQVESGGIMDLDPGEFPGLVPGAPLAQVLGLRDTMIEVDLTPNRPDCAGVIGLARELAGSAGLPLRQPEVSPPELAGSEPPFAVKVEAPDCLRYCARLIRGVKIAPSPWWLRRRLLAVGLRPINNVVDVTNYVMMEYGQPMHAFDFDRLAGGLIRVRRAEAGEKMTTLDGVERQLTPEMLLIADAAQAVAVAGIMGGSDSEVGLESVNILLESACFEAKSVRATAAALKLATDSSYRFERGVDPQAAPRALARAMKLIVSLAGGEVAPGGVDYREGVVDPPLLTLRLGRINDLLGTDLDLETVARHLAGIEIHGERLDDQALQIRPPSFRVDLEREVDLIEEVARLIGYDRIPTAMPMVAMEMPATADGDQRPRIKAIMAALGCYEAVNYSFVNPAHADWMGLDAADQRRRMLPLLNPLSEEQGVMRTTLLPGLLENARHNINHQCPDLRLFELGKVFFAEPSSALPREEERLAAVFGGRRHPGSPLLWEGEATVDLYDLKGLLEELLDGLRRSGPVLVPAEDPPPYALPGSCFNLNHEGGKLGECGKLHPRVLKAFGIKQELLYLDLSSSRLLALPATRPAFTPLPRFPSVKWDLALLVPEEVPAGEMLTVIRQAGGKLLEHVEIFDVYRGKNIEPGRKSVAFAIHYRDAERTLNEETVAVVHRKIIDQLVIRFHGQLREA
ncbi:phenylalanine--tRNA ligase subunit beta [Desulfurivibrio sp. D14AmB]|uniref:phenylalanine--tRNA ligase subunit beta n=1 Tax=Desulfurivibrio sp. D14AmB TaxID=3374370 RepID=UPI00376EC36A